MANLFFKKRKPPVAFDSQESLPTTSVDCQNDRVATGTTKFSRFRFSSFRQPQQMAQTHSAPMRNPSELDFDTGSYHSFSDQIYQGFSSSSSEAQSRPESAFIRPPTQQQRPLVSVLKQKNSEDIYTEVFKPKKRVCFARESDISSTISYDCDVESTSTAESGRENFFKPPGVPSAGEKSLSDLDLCTTPTRFPKTNPHFSFPKNILPWRTNKPPEPITPLLPVNKAFPEFNQFYSGSSSSSSSASHDTSGSTGFSQQQRNENITRILRGMKSFGIKGNSHLCHLAFITIITIKYFIHILS